MPRTPNLHHRNLHDHIIMANPRTSFICARCAAHAKPTLLQPRTFASFPPSRAATSVKYKHSDEHIPRWKETPPAMKMPVRLRPLPQNQPRWSVNKEDEPVDQMYDRFVGERAGEGARGQEGMGERGIRGSELLDEEVKVCHQSQFHLRLPRLGRGFGKEKKSAC